MMYRSDTVVYHLDILAINLHCVPQVSPHSFKQKIMFPLTTRFLAVERVGRRECFNGQLQV